MSCRMRPPETTVLHISRGDWLLVKKHLTAGENKAYLTRSIKDGSTHEVDHVKLAFNKMVAYLLDWSITDLSGAKVPIADQPREVVEAALDNALDIDSYSEIKTAIEKHVQAMDAEREAEKNSPDGASTSSPISPSPNTSGGDSNGLTNLTLTSVASS